VHAPEGSARGVVVLAHAAMARRTSFDRPRGDGLTRFFSDRGWRVVAFDFRGHGDSGPSSGQRGSWSYDDLVARDAPVVHSFARSLAGEALPVVAVGHSLGGHVLLAAQGTGRVGFDALVAVGANVWVRELEPSAARWLAKTATLRAATAIARRAGTFPARLLRAGSDDESLAFFEDFARFARSGWTSRDGQEDYARALGRVTCPVMQVVSGSDRLLCVPECGERFVARCGGQVVVERVEVSDDGGPAPSHMGMVTSGRMGSVWRRVEEWMRGATGNE
jgi:predicted alpha/beta hydrolase